MVKNEQVPDPLENLSNPMLSPLVAAFEVFDLAQDPHTNGRLESRVLQMLPNIDLG
jgi:hypothetical protein